MFADKNNKKHSKDEEIKADSKEHEEEGTVRSVDAVHASATKTKTKVQASAVKASRSFLHCFVLDPNANSNQNVNENENEKSKESEIETKNRLKRKRSFNQLYHDVSNGELDDSMPLNLSHRLSECTIGDHRPSKRRKTTHSVPAVDAVNNGENVDVDVDDKKRSKPQSIPQSATKSMPTKRSKPSLQRANNEISNKKKKAILRHDSTSHESIESTSPTPMQMQCVYKMKKTKKTKQKKTSKQKPKLKPKPKPAQSPRNRKKVKPKQSHKSRVNQQRTPRKSTKRRRSSLTLHGIGTEDKARNTSDATFFGLLPALDEHPNLKDSKATKENKGPQIERKHNKENNENMNKQQDMMDVDEGHIVCTRSQIVAKYEDVTGLVEGNGMKMCRDSGSRESLFENTDFSGDQDKENSLLVETEGESQKKRWSKCNAMGFPQ